MFFLDLKNIFRLLSCSKFIRALSVPAWNTAPISGVLHLLLTSWIGLNLRLFAWLVMLLLLHLLIRFLFAARWLLSLFSIDTISVTAPLNSWVAFPLLLQGLVIQDEQPLHIGIRWRYAILGLTVTVTASSIQLLYYGTLSLIQSSQPPITFLPLRGRSASTCVGNIFNIFILFCFFTPFVFYLFFSILFYLNF